MQFAVEKGIPGQMIMFKQGAEYNQSEHWKQTI